VTIYPRSRPAQPGLLRVFFGIKKTKHARRFDEPVVLGDGTARCIALRLQDIFLLQDGVAPNAIAVVVLRLHQRVTEAAVLRESTRKIFPSGVIWRGMSDRSGSGSLTGPSVGAACRLIARVGLGADLNAR